MKPFIRKKLPYILIVLEAVLIVGILLYIVPGRFRLYDIVLYDAAEKVPGNPMVGYAPPAEEEEDCEKTNLVFIMLPFSEWEPQEGVFDTEGVEEKYHIEEYRQQKKHAVLRFVCDIPSQEEHADIPDWLRSVSAGREYDNDSGKGYAPDYSDETFLQAHKEALEALASWCGKDSFVSFVEIGSVGPEGDWNALDEPLSRDLREQYISQYEEAFSSEEDIRLLSCTEAEVSAAEDADANAADAAAGKAADSAAAKAADGKEASAEEAADNKAAGSWQDALGDSTLTGDWIRSSLEGAVTGLQAEETAAENKAGAGMAGDAAEADSGSGDLWSVAPVGGGLTDTIPMDTLLMDNLSDTLEQIRISHITFIGPGCPDKEQQETNGSEMILRNVGYSLYLSRLQTTVDFLKDDLLLHFTFDNIGIAPMYWDWPATMYIYDSKGNCIRSQTLDLRLSELMPGSKVTVTGSVPYSRDLLDGYSVGLSVNSPDGQDYVTFIQKGVIPNREGVHLVYKYKKLP